MRGQKPGKRIVSKGEYAAIQTTRTVLRVSSVLSIMEVSICVFLAVYLPFLHFGLIGWLAALFCALMAFRFGRLRSKKIRLAASVEDVLPLTHTTAALLPPVQTLLRASAPSPQEQQNVLLRATRESQATPADQLLRATDDVPHTAEVSALASQVGALQEPQQTEETGLWQAGEGQEEHEEQMLRVAGGQQ